jgi:hypothetical protein
MFYVFLITPINVVILYPTIIIIPFFIFELLLSNRYCLDIELLLSWTITI